MVDMTTREPRSFVDFATVPPSQWKMHDRLENWARASRGGDKQSGDAAPMFALYRSNIDRGRQYGAETVVPVDRSDAIKIAKGIAFLPDKHRRSLQWYYVHPRNPSAAARSLGLTLQGLAQMVIDARYMLINRGV